MISEQTSPVPDRAMATKQWAGSDEQAPWTRHLHAGSLFFIAYLLFFLVSKLVGFSPGYALDDYGIIRQGGSESLIPFFISQGRYGSALMDIVLHACNLSMANFSSIGLAVTAVFSGLFFKDALALPRKASPILAVGLGAMLGAHPYYTEYVSFRQAALPMSMMFLGMWVALRLYQGALQPGSPKALNLIGSLLAATLVMGFNQLAVSYLAIAVLCVHARRLQNNMPPVVGAKFLGGQTWLEPILRAALAGALLIACNIIVAKLTQLAWGITATQRNELIAVSMLGQRADELMRLLPILWSGSEPIAAWPAKALALASLGILLATHFVQAKATTWFALAIFIVATAAALIPATASSIWWPVPRTLIAVPFALAAPLALLIPTARPSASLAGLMLIASGCLFAAHSQSMLFNQQRLNRWDQMQARDISHMAVEKFPQQAAKLAIVSPMWGHDIAQGIAQGDFNISALSVGWALDPLFDEATGRDQSVRLAPEFSELCTESAKYPDPASLHREQDEVVVCMH